MFFNPGVTSQVITVTTVRNNLDQADLHYYLDLSNPVAATIALGQAHAFAIIRTLDPPVTVPFVPVQQPDLSYAFQQTVYPDGASMPVTTQTVTFLVSLVGFDGMMPNYSGKTITVTYSTQNGTDLDQPVTSPMTTPAAFVGSTGTLTFVPGQTTPDLITVQVNSNAPTGREDPHKV